MYRDKRRNGRGKGIRPSGAGADNVGWPGGVGEGLRNRGVEIVVVIGYRCVGLHGGVLRRVVDVLDYQCVGLSEFDYCGIGLRIM